ncbi:MAG: hypothetical protein IPP28_05790 [Xanthomonadales bacterium]|nr:hypothetical protein [Xanthomonadales bacterium]
MIRIAVVLATAVLLAALRAGLGTLVADAVDGSAQLQLFRAHYTALKAAARGNDVALLLREADATHALAPDVPMVIYLRAVAQAANAQNDAAFESLSQLADTGLAFDIDASPAFAALRSEPRFATLTQRFADNGLPRASDRSRVHRVGLADRFRARIHRARRGQPALVARQRAPCPHRCRRRPRRRL